MLRRGAQIEIRFESNRRRVESGKRETSRVDDGNTDSEQLDGICGNFRRRATARESNFWVELVGRVQGNVRETNHGSESERGERGAKEERERVGGSVEESDEKKNPEEESRARIKRVFGAENGVFDVVQHVREAEKMLRSWLKLF